MLAEGHTVADGGRAYTIRLRRGVRFHNGKEMTSADVVASLNRWGRMAGTGKAIFKNVEAVEAKDPYTIVIHMKSPSGVLLAALARPNNGAAIYPKEVCDAAADGQLKEVIGTGPFRFVEHKPDRHIRLARFKDYAARTEAPDGYAGRRTAFVDEILFIPVPDVAVRLAGIETGDYHVAQQIKQDQYDRIKTMPGVAPRIVKPYGWSTAVLNQKQGPMTDKRLRQALQAALDMEPIMAAGFGHKDFYRLDPGLLFPEQPAWWAKTGGELYNQKSRARAQTLLKDAGYAGQPIRWITTQEYQWMYKNALVAKQQLEEAGLKIDLQDPRARVHHGGGLQLARLVVPRGEEQAHGGARDRARPEEAAGDVGAGPGPLLRGRRAHQVRRLLPARRDARGGQRLPGVARAVSVERLAR
jgi:peptide/nickel transport system substrate-binding protein